MASLTSRRTSGTVRVNTWCTGSNQIAAGPRRCSVKPSLAVMEADYKRELHAHFGIEFSRLFAVEA